MKHLNRLSRLHIAAAFAAFSAAFVLPLSQTWTSTANASFAACALDGSASWTGYNADGSSYTVLARVDSGSARPLAVRGTPPPLADLPVTLYNGNGDKVTITAVGSDRQYDEVFEGTVPQSCACQDQKCDMYNSGCETLSGMTCSVDPNADTCYEGSCGGGGGTCSGGACTVEVTFGALL